MVPPVLLVPKVTTVVFDPLQTTWFGGSLTCAEGFTVIEKLSEGPVQLAPPLVNVGVTVIVAVTGEVPALIAANEPIFPVPLAASPIAGVLLVQA